MNVEQTVDDDRFRLELAFLGGAVVGYLVAQLLRNPSTPPPPEKSGLQNSISVEFTRIASFIEDNLTNPDLTPSLLITEFNISRTGLYRVFTGFNGVKAYIMERRLANLYNILTDGSSLDSIEALARTWQFSDAPHFVRMFKRRYKITPAVLRRKSNLTSKPKGAHLLANI